MKKKLNEQVLELGDIILTTTSGFISKAIQSFTSSDISHTMVYVGKYSAIDATGEGVHARNTQRLLYDKECPVYVMRLINSISQDQLKMIINFLREQVGVEYSKRQAVLTIIGDGYKWNKKQFCSRLVAQAFAHAEIKLVSDPNYCSPADIKKSQLLETIPNATVEVTPEEAALWEGLLDLPQIMRNSINALMNGVREKNQSIQTFDDLHRHLILHTEDDATFCQILDESGYLSCWQLEMATNPWQYDLEQMLKMPTNKIQNYCWTTLSEEEHGPHRFIVNRGGYHKLERELGIDFFHKMAKLFEILSELHRERIETATQWLVKNNKLILKQPTILIPHSQEWFEALRVWDPIKAEMTSRILEMTGSLDVCSICGNDPAHDYQLEEAYRPAGGVDTLRLCDDCLAIRTSGGEPFVSLILDENV